MSTIGHKLAHELRELIPVTLFFLVAFLLLAVTRMLLLAEEGIKVSTFAAAAIGALVVAKVVVIADCFSWVDRFPRKPLIWNVLWKTSIYFLASFAVRYLEHLIHSWRRTGSFVEGNRQLFDEIVWPHFWCVQMWLLILLLVFCAIRELSRAVGRDRLIGMFFLVAPTTPPDQPTEDDSDPRPT